MLLPQAFVSLSITIKSCHKYTIQNSKLDSITHTLLFLLMIRSRLIYHQFDEKTNSNQTKRQKYRNIEIMKMVVEIIHSKRKKKKKNIFAHRFHFWCYLPTKKTFVFFIEKYHFHQYMQIKRSKSSNSKSYTVAMQKNIYAGYAEQLQENTLHCNTRGIKTSIETTKQNWSKNAFFLVAPTTKEK